MMSQLDRALLGPRFLPTVFAGGLILRLALILLVPVAPESDARWYFERAVSLAAGLGYVEAGLPTAFWPVGYPAFLAAVLWLLGPSVLAGQLANLALAMGSLWLVLAIARPYLRDERAARVAVALGAVYPNSIGYTALLLTEVLVTFLLLLGAYLLTVRRGRASMIGSGLVFGLAALTKPQFIFFPAFLVILRARADQPRPPVLATARLALIVYGIAAVVLLPWAVRNTLVLGEMVLIATTGGVTLLTGNNPSADGGYNETDPLVAQRRFSVKDQVAADRRARDLALQWIRQNPGRFLRLVPAKLWAMWARDGEAEWGFQAGYPRYDAHWIAFRTMRVANQVFYLGLLASAAVTAIWWRRLRARTWWPLSLAGAILVAYLSVIAMIFSGQSRFHFPVMPWIAMYAGWALATAITYRAR